MLHRPNEIVVQWSHELPHVLPVALVSRLREVLGATIRVQPVVESIAKGKDMPAGTRRGLESRRRRRYSRT